MELLVLLIIVIISAFLLGIIIEKLFGIEKMQKVSETSGKQVDRWGRIIIFVFLLCALPFFITKEASVMKWYFILFLILSFGFESIMEWKYLKNSKQCVVTLVLLILGVIFIYNIEDLLILKN